MRFRSLVVSALSFVPIAFVGSLPCAEASRAEETPASEQSGLTESQRQHVFREVAAAEGRAEREAAKRFETDPESEGQVDLTNRLSTQYRAEIAEKYGLTADELVELEAEGFEEGWPTNLP